MMKKTIFLLIYLLEFITLKADVIDIEYQPKMLSYNVRKIRYTQFVIKNTKAFADWKFYYTTFRFKHPSLKLKDDKDKNKPYDPIIKNYIEENGEYPAYDRYRGQDMNQYYLEAHKLSDSAKKVKSKVLLGYYTPETDSTVLRIVDVFEVEKIDSTTIYLKNVERTFHYNTGKVIVKKMQTIPIHYDTDEYDWRSKLKYFILPLLSIFFLGIFFFRRKARLAI